MGRGRFLHFQKETMQEGEKGPLMHNHGKLPRQLGRALREIPAYPRIEDEERASGGVFSQLPQPEEVKKAAPHTYKPTPCAWRVPAPD